MNNRGSQSSSMSHLNGLRVVRGPDWRWGDQDGGEGHAGTVCTLKSDKVTHRPKELLPGMVYVNWDTGDWGKYRCGYQGFHDLRILDSSATGVRHPQIPCGDCLVKEISGIRWQCTTCSINLCTNCFLKEVPHDENHYKFIRYDTSKMTNNPEIVSSWNNEGPQSRLKLLGIYPGAVVIPCQPEMLLAHSTEVGLVLPKRSSSEICVEWSVTKKQQNFPRLATVGVSFFRVLKPAIGGQYSPSAFSILKIPIRSLFEAPVKTVNTLYNAVKRGDLSAAKLLCNGVDVNALCNRKKPALVLACREGHKDIVEWLLAQVKIDLERPDNNGYRAIHRAVQRCDPEVLELLIRKGANLDSQNVDGWTPLHVALVCQYKESVLCVRILIQHGCNTALKDKEGYTALHTAIRFGARQEIIKLLLTSDGHVNLFNKNDKSALLLACEHQRKDTATIKLLVEAGADTKALDRDDNTAIILAIFNSADYYQLMNYSEMMILLVYLINYGCPWETVNLADKKAADILREKGYPTEVIKVLGRMATDVFKWIEDGTEQGYIVDRFGDKYIWTGRNRKDGTVGYRCDKMATSSRRCAGFARRITVDGVSLIDVETDHNHRSTEKGPSDAKR